MFHTRALTLCAVIATLAFGLTGCGNDAASPVTVSPDRHDFGDVRHGLRDRKSFTITNNATEAVTITMARPNCTCFKVVRQPRSRLGAGESTEFDIEFDTGALPPQRVRGKFVEVRTDNPDAPSQRVPLEGNIFSPWYVEPRLGLDFGMITNAPENFEPKVIKLRAEEGYELVLDRTLANYPDGVSVQHPDVFDVEVKKVEKGFDIEVALKRGAPARPGKFQSRVVLALKVKGPHLDDETLHKGFRLNASWPGRPPPPGPAANPRR